MDWSLISPMPGEVVIADLAAENAVQASLGRDAEILGYILSNVIVSRLGEMKIIRMDLHDPIRKENVGVAIRAETKDKIDEGIHLFR